jgi:uncharacterized protein (DUF2267 family)
LFSLDVLTVPAGAFIEHYGQLIEPISFHFSETRAGGTCWRNERRRSVYLEDVMSRSGLDVFDKTLQTTHIWLDELMQEIGPDRQVAWHVLGAVLRVLRDRLPVELAAHLGAQLPMLVRGAYYDQWRPADQPQRLRTREEFLERIGQELANTRPVNVQQAAAAVFGLLSRHVDAGQVEKVRGALPNEIRAIWPNREDYARASGGRDAPQGHRLDPAAD